MVKARVFALVFGTFLTLHAQIAAADGWPGSVVGNWSVIGNQSPGVLSITFQDAAGLCRRITGTIYGDPLEGFYCPFSGRIHFVRKSAATNDTSQAWTGNLSQAADVLRIGGTFTSVNASGGSLGEYNFSASK